MGEVRKIPHEFARTRGNTHQQTKKIPNSDELGILYWWRMVDDPTTCYSKRWVIDREPTELKQRTTSSTHF